MSSDASSLSGDRGSNSESEESGEREITRPNRWRGANSTWLGLTEQERDLAASLDTLRNEDLSIHLFNAHALKRKAREIGEAEKLGEKVDLALQEDTKGFVPPKVWTAWPLPPEDVPRVGDKIGPGDGNEAYTLKLREREWPSRELEEVLMSVTLRLAKERFERRGLDHGLEADQEIDIDMDMNEESVKSGSADLSQELREEEENQDSNGSEDDSQPEPPPEVILKPVVSADDDRSREILRPSIRHTLSMLDEVLMTLHHARNTCRQYGKSDVNTDDEDRATSVASFASEDPKTLGKKPRGRPRKFAGLPNRSKTAGDIQEQSPALPELLRTKKTHRGRPQKNYERLENETQQEYLIRIARIQKKPLPSFTPPIEPSPSPSPSPSKRYRTSPAKRATEDELTISRNKKLGLRDWSEILGAAALVGFDPGVIERATRRCAALFGEGMAMRTFVEASFAEPVDSIKTYQPDMISDFGEEHSISISSGTESSSEPEFGRGIKSKVSQPPPRRKSTSKPPRIQVCFCPVVECPRKVQGFRDLYSLKRHLRAVHGIAEEDAEEYLIPSDEEMDGAVHVDGFLRPLKPMRRSQNASGGGKGKKKEPVALIDDGDDVAEPDGGPSSSELEDGSGEEDESSSSSSMLEN